VLVTGGGRPKDLDHGFYVEPTIFRQVPRESSLWREEIFGPVLAIRTFVTEDVPPPPPPLGISFGVKNHHSPPPTTLTVQEAVREANDTMYGLAAAVLSRDPQRCKRVARAFRAGQLIASLPHPWTIFLF
jgi:betaine-aldehyde dehydrogenase